MNDKTFKISILACTAAGIIIEMIILNALKRKGVDIRSNKIILKTAIPVMLLIVFLPIWFLDDVPLHIKIIAALLGVIGGVANLFTVDRTGSALRKQLRIKSKWDIKDK
jgi:hypothetical protein